MAAPELPVGAKRAGSAIFLSAAAWTGYVFLMLPSFIVIPMSFGNAYEMVFPPTKYSTALFEKFFFTSNWMEATWMSFRVAAGATIVSLVLGVPAAYSIVRGNYPGKKYVTMLLLSPILIPIIVIALGLYFYFASLGITGSELSLVLGHAVYTTPFVIVTAMAGLRHVDQNLETAATIMGAGPLYTFFRVTLPLLKSAMFAGGLFAFLMSFDEVVIAYFISKAGSTTLPVKMFSSIQWEISPVLAAVSTFLTVVSLVICLIGALFQKKA
jgi:putative spermidine/putrescine transport system permease protein